jgi:hypothetical protein
MPCEGIHVPVIENRAQYDEQNAGNHHQDDGGANEEIA